MASVGPSCDSFCHLHHTRSDEERGHRFCLLPSFLCTTYVLIPAIMPILRHVAGTAAVELDHSGQESNVADEQTPSEVVPRAIIPTTIAAPLSLAEVMHSLQTTGTVPGCRKVRVSARRQVPFSVWVRITRVAKHNVPLRQPLPTLSPSKNTLPPSSMQVQVDVATGVLPSSSVASRPRKPWWDCAADRQHCNSYKRIGLVHALRACLSHAPATSV